MKNQVPDLDNPPGQSSASHDAIPLSEVSEDLTPRSDAPSDESIDESLGWKEPEVCKCQHCGKTMPLPKPKPTLDEQESYVAGIRWTLQSILKIPDHRTRADAPFAMAKDYAPDLVHNLSFREIVATGATHTKHHQRLSNIAVEIRDGLTDNEGKPLEIDRPLHAGMKSTAARAKLCGPRSSRTGRKPKSEQPEPFQEPVAARLLIDDYSLVTNE